VLPERNVDFGFSTAREFKGLEKRIETNILKNPYTSRLANIKVYATFFGLAGCLIYSWSGYFNATLSTIEKQFKISSTTVGVISSGYDLSSMLTSIFLCYYASKQHRARFMALGRWKLLECLDHFSYFRLFSAMALFSVGFSLFGFTYLIYGPGEDALALGLESQVINSTSLRTSLCLANSSSMPTTTTAGNPLGPQVIFFVGCFIGATGAVLFCNLGITYLDDNVHKNKAPMLISLTNFVRMLGAPIGFMLAGQCLKIYVVPSMHPPISDTDPRWTGAWWMGWFIISSLGLVWSLLFGEYLLDSFIPIQSW
jgi:solute carrier organic anion transporter family, member 5A